MFIERPQARLWTTAFGSGPASLIALGGWAAGGDLWHDVFAHLGAWRCVALDHRGSGASQHSGPITLDDMADDVLATAEAWRLTRPVLAAESSGSAVALELALRQPRRWAGLVLVGAAWERVPPGGTAARVAALQADFDGFMRQFARNCLPEPDTDALQQWGFDQLRRATPHAAAELLQLREQVDLAARVPAITLPVLLLHGSADRIAPLESAQRLGGLLPHAALQVMDGLGHVPLLTAPQRVAEAIRHHFEAGHSVPD